MCTHGRLSNPKKVFEVGKFFERSILKSFSFCSQECQWVRFFYYCLSSVGNTFETKKLNSPFLRPVFFRIVSFWIWVFASSYVLLQFSEFQLKESRALGVSHNRGLKESQGGKKIRPLLSPLRPRDFSWRTVSFRDVPSSYEFSPLKIILTTLT